MATKRVARFRVDVETAPGVFSQVRGVKNLDFPPVNMEFADSSSFENDGYGSQEVVAGSWMATVSAWVKTDAADPTNIATDPVQAFIQTQSMLLFNGAPRLQYRIYDKNGGAEAYQGYAYTSWKYDGADWKSLAGVTIALQGDGPLATITNPLSGSQVPAALTANVTPTAQTAGNLVTVKGQNLTGTTGLTVNAVAVGAGKFAVINGVLTFVMPAGSAGVGNLLITNAAGVSASIPYTRGA